ncbi:MAG TPA: site-specific DNA-methyltransferase [Anaerolineales bacterium]|nr:site-specific DNA-methyltransferase [Anaerolineales bacterium]
MASNFEKLQTLLSELFQLDQADLDFGIYCIMNQKRDEITRFLEKELLPQVKASFAQYRPADKKVLEAELQKAIQGAQALGVDPDLVPKVKELREQATNYSLDTVALENEVYSHLYSFFRRYYESGDFISMRRYKEGVYAIPYEGEEVKLHWANADQYYIKTAEYFRDYTFKLPSGRLAHFKIVEAETERDNVKSADEKDRRFLLARETPTQVMNGEFVMRFEYRADAEKRDQKALNALAVETIRANTPADWMADLFVPAPTASNPRLTLLEKRLSDYTARNTFDYFIHKDLRGFLRRELDFYIKNEVMHLDDVESETAPRVEQYLSKIKALRSIAHKIIEFLAQIENFQKKLWLKKKFVVETNYCITLDRVPEELYPEIAANDAQREEWVRLFAIDEIKGDLVTPGYSVPITIEFLKANRFLLLDTKFFDSAFKDSVFSTVETKESEIDGLLIYSENFQALNLIQTRYKNHLDIYLDPPYNKGGDGFVYKDNYRHSSWLSMMRDRLMLANNLMNVDSRLAISIDDIENGNLLALEKDFFGEENLVGNITWEKRTKAQNTETAKYMLQSKVEYIHVLRMNSKRQEFNLDVKGQKEYTLSDELGPYRLQEIGQMSSDGMRGRQTMIFPIKGIMPNEGMQWKVGKDESERLDREERIILINNKPHILMRPEHEDAEIFTPFWSHFFEKDVYGTAENGLNEVGKQLGFGNIIETVKPINLIQKLLFHILDKNDVVMDFFAGSGTTGHAVINLNRDDPDKLRKYILVEMGFYFDLVTKPRIQKVVYSKDWKDGKPISREGISHCFKYIRLESFEDTLNNLSLHQKREQQLALGQSESFRESYMLSYMLDAESQGSLLNIESFRHPFAYQLKIATGTVGESKPTTIDLVETFNYLVGLRVQTMQSLRGFRVITGLTPEGERVLIIWRDLDEKDNAALEEFFRKQDYNPRDMEFDLIFVNGDNNLENLRRPDETWKVRLIEEEFLRRMFDTEGM